MKMTFRRGAGDGTGFSMAALALHHQIGEIKAALAMLLVLLVQTPKHIIAQIWQQTKKLKGSKPRQYFPSPMPREQRTFQSQRPLMLTPKPLIQAVFHSDTLRRAHLRSLLFSVVSSGNLEMWYRNSIACDNQ